MATDTTNTGDLSSLVDRLEKVVSGASLAETRGQPRQTARLTGQAEKIRERLAGKGVEFDEAGNPVGYDYDPTDFGSGMFNLSDANRMRGLFKRKTDEGDTVRPRFSQFSEQNRQILAERKAEESTKQYEQDFQPMFEQIRGVLQEMLSQDTISARELADMRTNITEVAKGAEESRLRRVAAVLGTRGLDPGSPAGAALAARVAAETDASLVESLRRLGLDAEQINESSRAQELGLAQQALLAEISAKNAALAADTDRLFDIGSQISGLMEAIRQHNEAMRLQEKMMDQEEDLATKGMYTSIGTALISSAGKAAGAATGGGA